MNWRAKFTDWKLRLLQRGFRGRGIVSFLATLFLHSRSSSRSLCNNSLLYPLQWKKPMVQQLLKKPVLGNEYILRYIYKGRSQQDQARHHKQGPLFHKTPTSLCTLFFPFYPSQPCHTIASSFSYQASTSMCKYKEYRKKNLKKGLNK